MFRSAASTVGAGIALAIPETMAGGRVESEASSATADSGFPQQAQTPAGRPGFEIEKLADGVFAAIRTEPVGFGVDANVVFIINDDDVLVVDTNLTPGSARETLAALRKLTAKPVRYVVNTHWHDDHIMGNQVYRDAFPGVEFIAHQKTRDYLPTKGEAVRRKQIEGAAEFGKELQGLIDKNKGLGGQDLTDEERESYSGDIRLIARYAAEDPGLPVILPTLTLEDRLTIYRGARAIEVLHLGRGHTAGDIVVHLPQERIAITGDLVVWPIPLIGSDQSHIAEWSVTLEKLRALQPVAFVPGHGRVLRDDSYVKLMASLMVSAQQQAEAAVARGETLEEAHKNIKLAEFRTAFAGDSKVRSVVFSNYVLYPVITAAYNEALAKSPAKPSDKPSVKPAEEPGRKLSSQENSGDQMIRDFQVQ